jgi:hypothetical protein
VNSIIKYILVDGLFRDFNIILKEARSNWAEVVPLVR